MRSIVCDLENVDQDIDVQRLQWRHSMANVRLPIRQQQQGALYLSPHTIYLHIKKNNKTVTLKLKVKNEKQKTGLAPFDQKFSNESIQVNFIRILTTWQHTFTQIVTHTETQTHTHTNTHTRGDRDADERQIADLRKNYPRNTSMRVLITLEVNSFLNYMHSPLNVMTLQCSKCVCFKILSRLFHLRINVNFKVSFKKLKVKLLF